MDQPQCAHLNLKVIHMENAEGSVRLKICTDEECTKIIALCECGFVSYSRSWQWALNRALDHLEEPRITLDHA